MSVIKHDLYLFFPMQASTCNFLQEHFFFEAERLDKTENRPFASCNVFVEHSSDKTIAVEQSACAHYDEPHFDDSFALCLQ